MFYYARTSWARKNCSHHRCLNQTYNPKATCFEHNPEIAEVEDSHETHWNHADEVSLLCEELERLTANYKTLKWAILPRHRKKVLQQAQQIAELTASIDQWLRASYRPYLKNYLEIQAWKMNRRNAFHPDVIAKASGAICQLPPAIRLLMRSSIQTYAESESNRRLALAKRPLALNKVTQPPNDVYIGFADETTEHLHLATHLAFRVCEKNKKMGYTHSLEVACELRGLGVARRLYAHLEELYPEVEVWYHSDFLRSDGRAFRKFLANENPSKFPLEELPAEGCVE